MQIWSFLFWALLHFQSNHPRFKSGEAISFLTQEQENLILLSLRDSNAL